MFLANSYSVELVSHQGALEEHRMFNRGLWAWLNVKAMKVLGNSPLISFDPHIHASAKKISETFVNMAEFFTENCEAV